MDSGQIKSNSSVAMDDHAVPNSGREAKLFQVLVIVSYRHALSLQKCERIYTPNIVAFSREEAERAAITWATNQKPHNVRDDLIKDLKAVEWRASVINVIGVIDGIAESVTPTQRPQIVNAKIDSRCIDEAAKDFAVKSQAGLTAQIESKQQVWHFPLNPVFIHDALVERFTFARRAYLTAAIETIKHVHGDPRPEPFTDPFDGLTRLEELLDEYGISHRSTNPNENA